MAIFRQVHTAFWTDSKVSENFTPEDRYFMLFLLTNPYTNMVGCYELSGRNMGFLMGYSHESITNLLTRFTKTHHLVEYDEQTREVLILNWSKYNWRKNPKLIPKMISDINAIKSISFRNKVVIAMKDFFGIEINTDTISISYQYHTDTITHEDKNKDNDKDNDNDNDKKNQSARTRSVSTNIKFSKPSLSEIIEFKTTINASVDPEYFYDYHEANGWKVSKGQPMKDWKATYRNWNRNQINFKKDNLVKPSTQNQSSYTDTEESTKRAKAMGIIVI